jgi:hypothetical protein
MRRWCPEDRSFKRKPLFKFTFRPAAEIRHRTGDAVEEPGWPTVLVDGTGRHWSHGHNDVGIDNIHVDAEVQPPVLRRPRSGFDGLTLHDLNGSNRQRRSSASPNEFPDSLRFLSADAAHAHQLLCIRSHDTFNGPEFEQQAMGQGRTHSWKAL